MPPKQNQGSNSKAEGTGRQVVSQPCLSLFRREGRLRNQRRLPRCRGEVLRDGGSAARPEHQIWPHGTTGALTSHPYLVLQNKAQAALAVRPERPRAAGSPSADWKLHQTFSFSAIKNALCSFHRPRGPGGSKRSVSGILCFHLGLSFPIYLAVSLNPSPHTTDIFLIQRPVAGDPGRCRYRTFLAWFSFLKSNYSPLPPCVAHGSLRLITLEILPIRY